METEGIQIFLGSCVGLFVCAQNAAPTSVSELKSWIDRAVSRLYENLNSTVGVGSVSLVALSIIVSVTL